MSNDIDEVIERHYLEIQKVKIGLHFLTRKVSDLDQTVSFLKSLKYDMFLSHDISNIEIAEDNPSYHLYEEVNNAYDHLKKQFDEFKSNQGDMEWAAQLIPKKPIPR
jgi:hypothetical protein